MTKDTIRRVRYRERQLLRAVDLQDEQTYRLAQRRRHGIAHHDWGIVTGLTLTSGPDDALWVQPGLAVDGFGRELNVPDPVPLPTNVFGQLRTDGVAVWLLYDRVAGTTFQRGRWACGPDQHERWREEPRLRLTAVDDGRAVTPRSPMDVSTKDLDFGPHRLPPDDPQREWPVYLGCIRNDGSLLGPEDLRDPVGLMLELREAKNPRSKHLWERFSDDFQERLAAYDGSDPPSQELQRVLVNELNRLLRGDSLYAEAVFPRKTLRQETRRLLALNPRGRELIHLNRLLLEDSYPQEIRARLFFQARDLLDPFALARKLRNTQNILSRHFLRSALLLQVQDLADPANLLANLKVRPQKTLQSEKVRPPKRREATHRRLRKGDETLGEYLRKQFPVDFREQVDAHDDPDSLSEELQRTLVKELNGLLPGASLYAKKRFPWSTLREETRRLAKTNPQGTDLIHLNRLLLEDAYPEIKPLALFQLGSVTPRPSELAEVLLDDLNRLLQAESLYDAATFAQVALRGRTRLFTQEPQGRDRVHLNRMLLDAAYSDELTPYPSPYTIDLDNRPYVGLVGEGIAAPSGRARLQVGGQVAEDRRRFAVILPQSTQDDKDEGDENEDDENEDDENEDGEKGSDQSTASPIWKDHLAIDRSGNMTLRGNTSLEQDLVFAHPTALLQVQDLENPTRRAERGLILGALDVLPAQAEPWQIYHTIVSPDKTPFHQLRMEIAHPGDKGDPTRSQLVIGHVNAGGVLVPCLTVRADGTVIAHGDVLVQGDGQVIEGPIQADPSDPRFPAAILESWVGGISTAATQMETFYSNVLQVTLQGCQTPIHPDDTFSYNVLLRNTGQTILTNVQVVEILTVLEKVSRQQIASGLGLAPGAESDPIPGSSLIPGDPGNIVVFVTAVGDTPEGYKVQGSVTQTVTVA